MRSDESFAAQKTLMKERTGRLLVIVSGSDHDEKDDPNKDDLSRWSRIVIGASFARLHIKAVRAPPAKLRRNKRKRGVNRIKAYLESCNVN